MEARIALILALRRAGISLPPLVGVKQFKNLLMSLSEDNELILLLPGREIQPPLWRNLDFTS